MHAGAAEKHHIVDGFGLPAVGRPCQQQAARVESIAALGQQTQLFGHLLHLAGGQKARAAQVDAQHRLAIMHTVQPGFQQRTVTADGDDEIGFAVGFFLRQKADGHLGFKDRLGHDHGHTQLMQQRGRLAGDCIAAVLGRVCYQ